MKTTTYFSGKYFLLLLFTALLTASCDNVLDTTPQTSISSGNAFATPGRILAQVNGIYKSLKGSELYGGRYLLYQDTRGEDFLNITANSYTGFYSWNHSYNSGSTDIINLWATGYRTINNANILIDGLSNLKGVIPDSVKVQYIAEARFARALSYFSLVTLFADPYAKNQGASPGLPLRLKAETSTENNDLARSSVAAVYTQILADLDSAEAHLPKSYATPLLNTTRAHRNTAVALKTRVYLNKGEYAAVVTEAQKIVPQLVAPFAATTGVLNKLQSDITTLFGSNFTSTESVFSTPSTTNDYYSGQSSITYIYGINSEYYLNPAGIAGDAQWGSGDARRNLLKTTSGKQFLKKFVNASYLDYIPVIRYSEVLLNYAEAAAQTGNLTLAANLLKAVHARADQSFVFPAESLATKPALIATILKERRIELLGEGFRSNDIVRYLQSFPAKGTASLQAPAVAPGDENYIYPLPSTEINTNKLL